MRKMIFVSMIQTVSESSEVVRDLLHRSSEIHNRQRIEYIYFIFQILCQYCDNDDLLNKPLIELAKAEIKVDMRYFGSDNFVGTRDSWTDSNVDLSNRAFRVR